MAMGYSGRDVNMTDTHRSLAVNFWNEYGETLALIAWSAWLTDPKHLYNDDGQGGKEPRKWLMHDFLANGDGKMLADDYKPYVELGFRNVFAIAFFRNMVDLED